MHGLGKVAYNHPLRFGPKTTPKLQVVASVEKESLAVGETEETPSWWEIWVFQVAFPFLKL